jgi:hypothetical protein
VYRRFSIDLVMGSAKGFPIDGDGFAAEGLGHILHPLSKKRLKAFGIDPCKETAEGVVGRDTVGELEEFFEPCDFGVAELGDLCPGVCAADDGAKRDQKDVVEAVASVVTSGILDAAEMFAEGASGVLVMV